MQTSPRANVTPHSPRCQRIKDHEIQELAKGCPGLESLILRRCLKVVPQPQQAQQQARWSFKNLKTLSLSGLPVLDEAIKQLVENNNRLTSVDLSECELITDKAVVALASNCKGLRDLMLSKCASISLMNREESLDDAGYFLSRLKCLRSIDFSHCRDIMRGGDSDSLPDFGKLASVSFANCLHVDDEAVIALAKDCGASLISVDFSGCNRITDRAGLALAEYCPSLSTIRLAWCYEITDESIGSGKVVGTGAQSVGDERDDDNERDDKVADEPIGSETVAETTAQSVDGGRDDKPGPEASLDQVHVKTIDLKTSVALLSAALIWRELISAVVRS